MTLKTRYDNAVKAAQDISARAATENREITEQEQSHIESHVAEAKNVQGLMAQAQKSADLIRQVGGIGPDDETPEYSGFGHSPYGSMRPGAGKAGVLALSGSGAKAHAAGIANQMLRKGVVESGSVVTAVPLQSAVIADGQVPHNLLQLLSVTIRNGQSYRYIRQTARTSNAAIVAPGAKKPTSIYTVEEKTGSLQVFAHLSEPVDKYLLSDAPELERFLASEMLYGLNQALEDEVLSGDGTTGHLTGLLATPGIQTQAAGPDAVSTLRSAITKLEVVGRTASAFVLNPTDWESIETARNGTGGFDLNGPVDRATSKVWGVPVVLSNGMEAGSALALDLDAATISTDQQGVEVKWTDTSGDLFEKNQLRVRVEGRFNLDVVAPAAVVNVSLPAAA